MIKKDVSWMIPLKETEIFQDKSSGENVENITNKQHNRDENKKKTLTKLFPLFSFCKSFANKYF